MLTKNGKCFLVLCALPIFFTTVQAQAALQIWDNGNGTFTWGTTGVGDNNWDAGSPWTNGNDAAFDTTGAGAITIQGAGVSAASVTINDSGDYVFGGGNLALSAATTTIEFTGTTSAATIDSVITGGNLDFKIDNNLAGTPARRLALNGANLYTGVTTLRNIFNGGADEITLRAGTDTAFGPATSAELAFIPNADNQQKFHVELFGNNVTIIGVNYGQWQDGSTGTYIKNGAATNSILTVNTAIGDPSSFKGAFQDGSGGGTLGLIKGGLGTLTLGAMNGGSHSYSGGLTIKQGTLSIARLDQGALGTGGVSMGDTGTTGTLQYTEGGAGTSTTSQNVALAAAGIGVFQIDTSTRTLQLSGVVSGSGDLTKTGAGGLTLSNVNTFTGDTTLSAGTLTLADNAGLLFEIGASGVNNGVFGTGTLSLLGDFYFDLTSAGATLGDSWNIVNVATLAETFGASFTVSGFTDVGGDQWEFINGPATYTFSEATGLLEVTAVVPEPSTFVLAALSLAGLGLVALRKKFRWA